MLSGCSSIQKSWKSQFSVVLFSCRQCLRILSVWGVFRGCLWCVCGVWRVSGCCLRGPGCCQRGNGVKTSEKRFTSTILYSCGLVS